MPSFGTFIVAGILSYRRAMPNKATYPCSKRFSLGISVPDYIHYLQLKHLNLHKFPFLCFFSLLKRNYDRSAVRLIPILGQFENERRFGNKDALTR